MDSSHSTKPSLGDVVLFGMQQLAVVRYVGAVHSRDYEEELYYGIEVKGGAVADGHNGSVEGECYFRCEMGQGLLVEASRIGRVVESEELLAKVAALWSLLKGQPIVKQMVDRSLFEEVAIENERLRLQLLDFQVLIQSVQMENEILRGDTQTKVKTNAELHEKVSKWADTLGISHMRRPTLSAVSDESLGKIHDILRADQKTEEPATDALTTLPDATDAYIPPVISRSQPSDKTRSRASIVAEEASLIPELKEDDSRGSLRRKPPASKHRSRGSIDVAAHSHKSRGSMDISSSSQAKRIVALMDDDEEDEEEEEDAKEEAEYRSASGTVVVKGHPKSQLSMEIANAPDWIGADFDEDEEVDIGTKSREEKDVYALASGMEILPDSRKMYAKHKRKDSYSMKAAKDGSMTTDTSDKMGSLPSGRPLQGVGEAEEDDEDAEVGHRKRGSVDMDAGHGRGDSISSVLSEGNYFNQVD